MKKALIIVDIQNDFLPGGALEVTDGDQIIPIVNGLIMDFHTIIATQDWHPADHGSFASQHPGARPGEVVDLDGLTQVLWPDHCVQDAKGAEFASTLHTDKLTAVFRKGYDRRVDSYSGFFDNGKRNDTGLAQYLKEHGILELYIVGLATDYCVKYTAIDAIQLGYQTTVIADATRAVNLSKGDYETALLEIKQHGITIINSTEL